MKGRFKSKWFACLHFVREKRKKSVPVDMIIADNLFTPRGSLVRDNPEEAESSSDTDSNSNKPHICIASNSDASTSSSSCSSSSGYNDETCLTKKAEIPQLQLNKKKKKYSSGKERFWKNNEKEYIEGFQCSDSRPPSTPCSDTAQSSPLSSPTTPTPGSSEPAKIKNKIGKGGVG